MNTPIHTPGPWEAEPKGSRYFVDGADGLTVAYLDRAGVRERAEIEANAHLIAAAPELLAALREIVTDYDAEKLGFMARELRQHTRERLIENARNVIAKAEAKA